MNDIEQAELTLLNNGIPIIVKTYNTMADAIPVNQVILYPIFVCGAHPCLPISQPKSGMGRTINLM